MNKQTNTKKSDTHLNLNDGVACIHVVLFFFIPVSLSFGERGRDHTMEQ